MAWIDDRLWCTQKLLALSDRAHRLWVNSIAFSSGMGTRGVLTLEQQQLVRVTRPAKAELVSSGLWDDLGDGVVRIHDWDDHNSKRDERREKDRERKRSLRSRPQERPQDSPVERPQDRRTLKVEKEETVEEPNGSSTNERPRNPIWDALGEVFGEPSTDTARKLRGKVTSSLTRAGATPEEILKRAKSWPLHFDTATLTETALEKHWDALGRSPMRVTR